MEWMLEMLCPILFSRGFTEDVDGGRTHIGTASSCSQVEMDVGNGYFGHTIGSKDVVKLSRQYRK